jgi:predicted secreted protein
MPNDNIEEIKLNKGESTQIKLEGLGTAGYIWSYRIDGNQQVVSVTKDFVMPEKKSEQTAGASADEIFAIKANEPGVVSVTFFQKRSWETNVAPVNEKKIIITVV